MKSPEHRADYKHYVTFSELNGFAVNTQKEMAADRKKSADESQNACFFAEEKPEHGYKHSIQSR